MKNSVKLGAVAVLFVAGYALAVDDSKLTFKLALGGDNQAAKWENPDDCSANLNPPFLPGDPNDGQTFPLDSKITWEARLAVSGTHGGLAPTGVANLVFSLELRDSGGNVIDFPASDANGTVKGWYSSINKEATAPATKRHNPTGSGGCGVTAVDARQLAAFTASFQVAAPNFNGFGRVIDQAAVGGPFMGYFLYPSAYGFPGNSTAATGKLLGMGAGYKKFIGSGCPFNNSGGEYCKYTTAEVTTPGIGTATGCASGIWSDVPVCEGQMNLAGLPAGTYTLALVAGTGNNLLSGSIDCVALNNPGKFAFKPDQATDNDTITFTVSAPTCTRTIAGRHIFYNNSAFDGNNAAIQPPLAGVRNDDSDAIATDKGAYLGGGVRAGFANVISYDKSINGIMVDIAPGTGCGALNVTAADFQFKVGNSNTLTSFVAAAAPAAVQVIAGAGDGGSDRVEITWATNAIPNSNWLQVTVLANANTGLTAPDVHYWGIAKGECGQGNTTTALPVTATDELAARNNPRSVLSNPAPIDFVYDYTRDRGVTATDQQISRQNQTSALTTALKLIVVP